MDRHSRSVALEKKHVHDVYDKIAPHFTDTRYKAWPKVKQFIEELEPGSVVADVGCGNGKYLHINPSIYKLGSDCCSKLTEIAQHRGHNVLTCDNINLPYRSSTCDAVISIAVIHHFATIERRVRALQELARITRPGGRVMICVWALEQSHRKFDAQDVLVPWHFQPKSRNKKGCCVQHSKEEIASNSSGSDEESTYIPKPKQLLKKTHSSNKKTNSNNIWTSLSHLQQQRINADSLQRLVMRNEQSRMSRSLQRANSNADTHQRSSSSDGRCMMSYHHGNRNISHSVQLGKVQHGSTGSSLDEDSDLSPRITQRVDEFLSGSKSRTTNVQLSDDIKQENFGNRLTSAIQELFVKRISIVSSGIKLNNDCSGRRTKDLGRCGSLLTRSQSEGSSNSLHNNVNRNVENNTGEKVVGFWKRRGNTQVLHENQSNLMVESREAHLSNKPRSFEDSGFSESPNRASIENDEFVIISSDDYTLCKTCPSLISGAFTTKHSPFKWYPDFTLWNGIRNSSSIQERRSHMPRNSAKAALQCMSLDIGMCFPGTSPATVELSNATAKAQIYRKATNLKTSLLKDVESPMESRSSSEESLSSIPVELSKHNSPRVRRNHSDSSFEKTHSVQSSPQAPKRAGHMRRCRSSDATAMDDDKEESSVFEPEDPSTCLRYYHVFKEGELVNLIQEYVTNLHVIENYYDHANWCIIAEKVNVWTI